MIFNVINTLLLLQAFMISAPIKGTILDIVRTRFTLISTFISGAVTKIFSHVVSIYAAFVSVLVNVVYQRDTRSWDIRITMFLLPATDDAVTSVTAPLSGLFNKFEIPRSQSSK